MHSGLPGSFDLLVLLPKELHRLRLTLCSCKMFWMCLGLDPFRQGLILDAKYALDSLQT